MHVLGKPLKRSAQIAEIQHFSLIRIVSTVRVKRCLPVVKSHKILESGSTKTSSQTTATAE